MWREREEYICGLPPGQPLFYSENSSTMTTVHFEKVLEVLQTPTKRFDTMIDTVFHEFEQTGFVAPMDFAKLAKAMGLMAVGESIEDVSADLADVLRACAALMALLGAVYSASDNKWAHSALVFDLDPAFLGLQDALRHRVFDCDSSDIESFKPNFRGWIFL